MAMAFVWLAVFLVAFLVPVSGLLPLDHGRKSRRKSHVPETVQNAEDTKINMT